MESALHRVAILVLVSVLFSILCISTAAEESSTASRCFQPIVTGPCRAYFPRWAWNAAKNDCVQFIFGGCHNNGNNFYSKEECLDECIYEAAPVKAKEGKCPVLQQGFMGICYKMCNTDSDCAGNKKCCSNGCGLLCSDPAKIKIKPGDCPAVPKDPAGKCLDTCSIDEQCPGIQKCCPNTCGASCMNVTGSTATPVETECALEWTNHNNTCYKFVSYSRNYHQASLECQKEHPRAHLAVLTDEDEAEWAHKYTLRQEGFQKDYGAWIGLKLTQGKWVWNDGSPLTYATDMGVNKENEQCVYLPQNMDIFSASSCQYAKQSLCQYSLQDGQYSLAAQQTDDKPNSETVVNAYVIVGILATVLLSTIVIGIVLFMKCRRRVIRTGDNSITVVNYKGYSPVLI
ncbi:uncharacterized protein [Ptychodera flava]|uniref:uncharacterized protein n=1 Tax=Ptychodera flava TaxID=63121 RepID=UPI00396A76B5